jgi:hypothetical protein
VDLGHNLSSDWSYNFVNAGSLYNVDPRISHLADNGGPTWTLALLPNSPAIDTGEHPGAPAIDQRGFPRGVCSPSDIGAFELSGPVIYDAVYRLGEGCWLRCLIPAPAGHTCAVQVSTNLVNWADFTNGVSGAGGWFEVTVPEATNCPRRFYRLRW